MLAEFAKVGFSDLSDVTNWGVKEVAIGIDGDGKRLAPEDMGEAAMIKYVDAPFVRPIDKADLPPNARAAVAEVSLGKDGFKIKMHDKVGALVQIGRHIGMFVDKKEISGPGGAPIAIGDVTPADAYRAMKNG